MTMESVALKVAHFDFTNDKGLVIKTDKYIVSLGDFGTFVVCSDKNLNSPLFSKSKVLISYDDKKNKLVINSFLN